MRSRCDAAAVALALVLAATPAGAQKEKRPDISGFRFVTGPKGDRPHFPGLNAVLLLTDAQKEKLLLARQETVGSEAVVAASRKVKENPDAPEADRQAARKLSDEAQGQFDRRVAEILTPAQKELLQSLQVLYGQAREAAAAEYGLRLVEAKGNEAETMRLREAARSFVITDFIRRLEEIMTPEQRAAFERAAAEEKQREATAGKKHQG